MGVQLRRGLIFDIQRFSVHDGPGIRTTVFMKGCSLRCRWCANPESQEYRRQLMLNDSHCARCGNCLEACPVDAISLGPSGRRIDWVRCDQCLQCVELCVNGGLEVCGRLVPLGELVEEIERDESFYCNSGGGMTVSGGEPLCQSEFVMELLHACRRKGIHSCLDTTGHAPWKTLKTVCAETDLLLFDIKHLDDKVHREVTGVGNELILSNLKRAAELKPIWLRVPLIAGFNDSEDHVARLGELSKEIGVERVSLLPYHEGGKDKCQRLGLKYDFEQGKTPDRPRIGHVKSALERRHLKVSVGS